MPIAMKLFFLGVRQLSKPIASVAKRGAQESPFFRQLMISVGRTLHRATIQITRLSEGKNELANIVPLNEQTAITRGSDVVSELVIYSVAGSTVFYEYRLQKREKLLKEQQEIEAEARRREEARDNERRQWDEFSRLNQRINLLQEQLWQQQQRRSWWWR
jgi:hypothetical protein